MTNEQYLQKILQYTKMCLHSYHSFRTQPQGGGYRFCDAVLRPEDIARLLEPKHTQDALRGYEGELRSAAGFLTGVRAEAMSEENGAFIPLEYLASVFQLSDFGFHCVCMSLAGVLERGIERAWGFLQDNLARRQPCFDHLVRTYSCEDSAVLEALTDSIIADPTRGALFAPDSSPALSREMRLEDRIVRFILGQLMPPEEYKNNLGITYRALRDEEVFPLGAPEAWEQFERLTPGLEDSDTLLLQIYGPKGVGKSAWAEYFAGRNKQGLLCVDLPVFLAAPDTAKPAGQLVRELILQQSMVCLAGLDSVMAESRAGEAEWKRLSMLIDDIKPYTTAVILLTQKQWKLSAHMPGQNTRHIRLEVPDGRARRMIWQRLTGGLLENGAAIESLAGKYELTGEQIESAVEDARLRAGQQGRGLLCGEDLSEACRLQLLHSLERYARRVPAVFCWEDLVLPNEPKILLRRAIDQVKNRRVVLEEWGFEKKLPYGQAVTMLFTGPSGTGKTMSAQVMAKELELELYKVDLSCVVSKYIGETEQNLRLVFDEAQKSQSILFFDEADSLFGKRTEVKDSHDKNANMEVSFLLQRLEDYNGIVVLSTNFINNIDAAFKRRISYIIEFSLPDAMQRLLLWKSMFPSAAPVGTIDFDYLAKNFEFTGSNIKNIAVLAAYDAAAKKEPVGMTHLVNAIRIEGKKIGKLLSANDFSEYIGCYEQW